jgi:hypothetical protein
MLKHVLLATAALTFAASANAATNAATPSDKAFLVGYAGWFDFIDQGNQAAQFGLEYRMKPVWYQLRPMLGANVTTDGSVYGYGGLNYDIALNNRWVVTPNFAAGLYGKGSNGKRLGGAIEFRSGIELAYAFNDASRVSLAFNHISNASIYDKNPGAEALLIGYHVPW